MSAPSPTQLERLMPGEWEEGGSEGLVAGEPEAAQNDPFLPSPPRYSTAEAKKLLFDISRASDGLDSTSCLITRLPYAHGTVTISHLVDREAPAPKLNRLRKWWGHEAFRVNSALNLITLDSHFHSGFDKSTNPLWTIIPTDEVVNDIKLFTEGATRMSLEERKAMYDKYDVRLTGTLNTYRFVPLYMLHGSNPFYRRTSTLPADDMIWDESAPLQDRLERSAIASALDNMIPIWYPFRDRSLQELRSHAHPFCIIVKAARALGMLSHLIPPDLEEVSTNVRLIADRWSNKFPSPNRIDDSSVGIPSSAQQSPHGTPSHGHDVRVRYAPYPPVNLHLRPQGR